MYKWMFNFIQRYECVKEYEGGRKWEAPGTWDARSHVHWSCWLSWISIASLFIHPLFVHLYVIAFLCYSPLMELWFQYYKEKNKPLHNIIAQMFERGIGFAVFTPIWVTAYVVVKVWNIYLLRLFGL